MERLDVLMGKYEEMREKLRADGYARILHYQQSPLSGRILCRILQLALVWLVWWLILAYFPKEAGLQGPFISSPGGHLGQYLWASFLMLLLWCFAHFLLDWLFSRSLSPSGVLERYLPVSGFFAKRRIREEIVALQAELNQLEEKDLELRREWGKFDKVRATAEASLGWRSELRKEIGKKPCLWTCRPSKTGNSEGESKFYIIGRSGYDDLLKDVALALEVKRLEEDPADIVQRFKKKIEQGSL